MVTVKKTSMNNTCDTNLRTFHGQLPKKSYMEGKTQKIMFFFKKKRIHYQTENVKIIEIIFIFCLHAGKPITVP